MGNITMKLLLIIWLSESADVDCKKDSKDKAGKRPG